MDCKRFRWVAGLVGWGAEVGGRGWPGLAGAGRGWAGLAGAGRGWPGLARAGRAWPGLAGAGQAWGALRVGRRVHANLCEIDREEKKMKIFRIFFLDFFCEKKIFNFFS